MQHTCLQQNSTCINLPGSFQCVCLNGFKNISNYCLDIDECIGNISICNDLDSICRNKIGGFDCECKHGFLWSTITRKCEDINECVFTSSQTEIYSTNVCDENSICVNVPGSFVCECKKGWNKTDLNYCSDIDECRLGLSFCSNKSICHNLPGSYECKCLPGFDGDGIICNDIDECANDENICQDSYHKCLNTIGSYKCVCVEGFITDLNGDCIGKSN